MKLIEWKQSSPAGAMSASAKDIGNFIIAHLQNGTYNNKQILKSQTVEEMHKRSFTNDPRVNGIAHGFWEGTINEKRILWHGGDIFYFHSALVLIPEENVGFFISFNSGNSTVAVQDAMLNFMDQFYPSSKTSEAKGAPSNGTPLNGAKVEGNLRAYLGNYEPARHEYTTLGKILGSFMSASIKESKEKGFTVTTGLPSITSHEYINGGNDVLTPLDPRNQLIGDIVFKRDESGNIKYMFQNNNPTTAYIKIPFYDAPMFNLGLVLTFVLIFLISIIVGIFKFIKKLRKKQKWSREETSIHILPVVGSLFSFMFIVLMGIMFSNQEIVFGLPTWSKYFFMLPWVVWALCILTLITTVMLWIKSFGTAFQRVYYTIISLAITVFSAWIIYWNLWVSKV
ncbi:serine hydrolase [Clostridium sp.]|uniref:serine hydrolase domain-containing protein n=1 Tax=Clostridium sp. TaxID=1506 RepID=UPI002FC62766